jgi:Bacterial mobilisation protein (MobC).
MAMENKRKNKSKGGRPKKEKVKLSTSINLKLTEEDFKIVKEKAEKLGMKATQYAREMTERRNQITFYIGRTRPHAKARWYGNNLNQIAKQANKSGFASWCRDSKYCTSNQTIAG